MPDYVEFFKSNDGENFTSVGKVENTIPKDEWGSIIKDFSLRIVPTSTRYIKVIGKSMIMCPEWHKGSGYEMHIFIDEITIK